MDVIVVALLALFGVSAGLLLGFGNYAGLKGTIVPGLLTGVLISIPALREHQYQLTAFLTGCAMCGCIVALFVPAQNPLKRYCRQQKSLYIRLGSYKLGRD